MDNAVNAVNKLFAKDPAAAASDAQAEDVANTSTTQDADVDATTKTTDSDVAPAVEHTHIKKQHETREQTFVEKEKHQDHYHTTIQPVADTEVLPEKHTHVQETEQRSINNDDGAAAAKAKADRAGFESTTEERKVESATKEPTQTDEHIHHHLHETIQPVIEKGKLASFSATEK